MPYQRLLIKLKAYGIGECMISWMQTLLTLGKQKTKNNSRGGDIKLERSFEWSAAGVGVGTHIIYFILK